MNFCIPFCTCFTVGCCASFSSTILPQHNAHIGVIILSVCHCSHPLPLSALPLPLPPPSSIPNGLPLSPTERLYKTWCVATPTRDPTSSQTLSNTHCALACDHSNSETLSVVHTLTGIITSPMSSRYDLYFYIILCIVMLYVS